MQQPAGQPNPSNEPLEVVVISQEDSNKTQRIRVWACLGLDLHLAAVLALGDGYLTDVAGRIVAPGPARVTLDQSPFTWHPAAAAAPTINMCLGHWQLPTIPSINATSVQQTPAAATVADSQAQAAAAAGAAQHSSFAPPHAPGISSGSMSNRVDTNIDEWTVQHIDEAMGAFVHFHSNSTCVPDLDAAFTYDWLPTEQEQGDDVVAKQQERIKAFFNCKLLQRSMLQDAFTIVEDNHPSPDDLVQELFPTLNWHPVLAHPELYHARADYLIIPTARSHSSLPGEQRRHALVVLEVNKDLYNHEGVLCSKATAKARRDFYVYGSSADGAILLVLTDLRFGGVVVYATRNPDPAAPVGPYLSVAVEHVRGMKALFDYLERALVAVRGDPFPSSSQTTSRALSFSQPKRDCIKIPTARGTQ